MAKKIKKVVKKSAKSAGAKPAAKAQAKNAKPAGKKPVKKLAPKVAKPAKVAKVKAPKAKASVLKTAKKTAKNLVSSILKKAAKPEKEKLAVKAAPVVTTKLKKAVEAKPPVKIETKKPVREVEESVSVDLVEDLALDSEEVAPEEVVLTDAEGRRYCRVRDCDQLSSVDGYCRYHYLLFWKRIQVRKKILTEGKLEKYVEDLTARYPDKFLEMLKKDLRNEKDFLAAIQELEIDEGNVDGDFEDEDQSFIDEVRGMSDTVGAREEEEF